MKITTAGEIQSKIKNGFIFIGEDNGELNWVKYPDSFISENEQAMSELPGYPFKHGW